ALQPRLGIFWTAVVFSASHTQYSISITEASVFVLALGLGILRRYTNTTTSMICHIAYDTMAGIGLAGYLLLLGLLAGVGLLWALSNRLIGQNTPPASM
ncbi:MAG: CPBP family glutamic-type intramembrane protease, partial [Candidatus Dormibacteraceae bacterium]